MDQMESDFAGHVAKMRMGAEASVTGGHISVYFHVVTSSNGPEVCPARTINRQINVLNNAYAPWGGLFNLAGTDTTANDTWFNGCYGNAENADEERPSSGHGRRSEYL
jgi:hypothetical protein